MSHLRLAVLTVLLGVLAAGGLWLYTHGKAVGRAEVLKAWGESQQAYDKAVRAREDDWEGQRRMAAAQRAENDRKTASDSAMLRANGERLRVALADAIKQLDAKDRQPATGSDGRSGDVLTNVCNWSGQAATVLAAYADRERNAAAECRSAWPR